MQKLTLASAAENDLEEIWRYIAEDNESAAEKLIRELISKFELLTNNQLNGTKQDDFPVDVGIFPFKNYDIYDLIGKGGIEVYRVFYGRRDIEIP